MQDKKIKQSKFKRDSYKIEDLYNVIDQENGLRLEVSPLDSSDYEYIEHNEIDIYKYNNNLIQSAAKFIKEHNLNKLQNKISTVRIVHPTPKCASFGVNLEPIINLCTNIKPNITELIMEQPLRKRDALSLCDIIKNNNTCLKKLAVMLLNHTREVQINFLDSYQTSNTDLNLEFLNRDIFNEICFTRNNVSDQFIYNSGDHNSNTKRKFVDKVQPKQKRQKTENSKAKNEKSQALDVFAGFGSMTNYGVDEFSIN